MKTKAAAAGEDRRPQLERLAFRLAQSCPVLPTNPRSCPLYEMRRLRGPEKQGWIRGLTVEQLDYLAAYHETCAAEMKRVSASRKKTRLSRRCA
ncbi:MAG: hypothetical protein ACHQ4G_08330 [Opitutales bacterium]